MEWCKERKDVKDETGKKQKKEKGSNKMLKTSNSSDSKIRGHFY